MKKKTVKEVKMHKFLVFACKSQDFAQIQKNFARSHDRVTVTFRNSESTPIDSKKKPSSGSRSRETFLSVE